LFESGEKAERGEAGAQKSQRARACQPSAQGTYMWKGETAKYRKLEASLILGGGNSHRKAFKKNGSHDYYVPYDIVTL
jgi:hypothetical protein